VPELVEPNTHLVRVSLSVTCTYAHVRAPDLVSVPSYLLNVRDVSSTSDGLRISARI
jgi:hypothetical protein